MDSDKPISIPFSEQKQQALIGHLLGHESLFKTVCEKIKPEWFMTQNLSAVYRYMLMFYAEKHQAPNRHELKNYSKLNSLQPPDVKMLHSFIDLCCSVTTLIRVKSITPDLTEWLHSTILLKGLKEASILYNNKNIKECHTKLMESVKEVQSTNFDRRRCNFI